MSAIREAWIAIGLSRAPADRPRAEAAVRVTYRRAGLPDSVRIIWAASPMSGAVIARSLLRGSTTSRVGLDIAGPAACRLWTMIQGLKSADAFALRAQVVQPISARVTEAIWRPIKHELARALGRPSAIPAAAYGQHDAPWLAFFDVLAESGVDVAEMESLIEIARSSGWWWPFDDVCVLTERPSSLSFDDEGRLHCSDGPAVCYPDGWALYAWHGAIGDADVILSDNSPPLRSKVLAHGV